jgi:hypothetical protein
MADLYRVSGTENPTVDWTSEVVLERDSDGNPSKVVSATSAVELSKANRDTLDDLGVKVEKVSAEKAAEMATTTVGADVAAAAPVLSEESK